MEIEIDKILKVVKKWVEDETGVGFGYHIGHCDDLSSYYDILKGMLEDIEAGKEINLEVEEERTPGRGSITGTAWNVDGSLVIEADKDWPNELREQDSTKVELDINFLEYLDNTDEGE